MILTTLALLCLQSSGDVDDALAKAATLAAEGRFESALAVLEPLGSDDARVLTARGTYLMRDTENQAAAGGMSANDILVGFNEAASVLEEASRMEGATVDTFVNWSEALVNMQDSGAALVAIEKGEQAFPKGDLALAMQKGRVYFAKAGTFEGVEEKQREAWTEARDVYRDALERFKDSAAPCVRTGEMEVYLGNSEAAQAAWAEALKREPAQVDLAAMVQWLGGQPSVAVLEAAIDANGEDVNLRWWQGNAAYTAYSAAPSAELWKQAKQSFLRALELNPEYSNTWWFLGTGAMAEAGRLRAENQTSAANEEYKLAARAWASYLDGFGPNQLEALKQMENDGATFVAQIQWLGGKAYSSGNWKAAASLARWVTAAKPEDAGVWNNYAFLLRETKQYEESLSAYRRADQLSPDDPAILNDMAVILHYYLKRDLEEAAELYQRAIALAEKQLENTEAMSEEQRSLVETALRDARNNLSLLRDGKTTQG